jgi:tRNA nucleotidyltransferase (CCA-adding enzyme)
MRVHHERLIQRLITHFQNNPQFPAMMVGSSAAKEWAGDDSDVDILLVATDEEYARRLSIPSRIGACR